VDEGSRHEDAGEHYEDEADGPEPLVGLEPARVPLVLGSALVAAKELASRRHRRVPSSAPPPEVAGTAGGAASDASSATSTTGLA
jgi:hypothetical protein